MAEPTPDVHPPQPKSDSWRKLL